ncbi:MULTISPECIES: TIGR00341 family protein [unclassified Haladaptatus]|uniref:TIGR00341 family protein n=1 Tax=unclassified Haladaptatus TaxID=2622732 RepID=UPI00209C6B0A|nr:MULTISPECIES: TIGR00341 family protein [unclassified Haladaptatus]MCO8243434.1 TIGR00341 family protein [Haladaptatus sp. AB643]MCO8254841.1 TIGR00341 family protein [Haladaptatus sp. AB618]
MRLIQVLIPEGDRANVLAALDEEGIDYAVWEETGRGDFEALVSFPVPDSGVEPVLDSLYAAGIKEKSYTLVMPTETVVSERIGALKDRYRGYRISRDELVARAEDLAPESSTFFIFLIVSTLIATTGLLLNSAATIIGAMVIAPLMGPAISASVGAVLADNDMTKRGVRLQVTGLLAAIVTAAVLGLLLKETVFLPPTDIRTIPQVLERTSPNFLSLFLALGSGVAGAVSVIRGAGSSLVGVAIAVALIPPAATAGLGLAWGDPGIVLTAGVLVLVNLLAINLSALILLWLAGYRPEKGKHEIQARRAVRTRIATVVVGLVLLSVVLGTVTWASFGVGTVKTDVNTEVKAMFNSGQFGDLEFEQATVNYDIDEVLLGHPADVTVVVSYGPNGQIPPDVAQRIDERLTKTTGHEVVVHVELVQGQDST